MLPKVYIVLVNFNGWQDTIECLESIFRCDYVNYQVIVVDNNSPDNSIKYLREWVEKDFNKLEFLSDAPTQKPMLYEYLITGSYTDSDKPVDGSRSLTFIQSDNNGGFAYASNIAIKYALRKNDFEYIWLLNNDTVIEKNTLNELVCGIQRHKGVGAAGSKIFFYDDPDRLQSLGSKVDPNSIFKLCKPVVDLKVHGKVIDSYHQDFFVDDIMGASILIKQAALKKVGMMPEEYFLYGEETDYNFNLKKNGYKLVTITNSKLYHKKSASTGGDDSLMTLYYRTRNQFFLYKKYMPMPKYFAYASLYLLKKLYASMLVSNKLQGKWIRKGLLHGVLGKKGKVDIPI